MKQCLSCRFRFVYESGSHSDCVWIENAEINLPSRTPPFIQRLVVPILVANPGDDCEAFEEGLPLQVDGGLD